MFVEPEAGRTEAGDVVPEGQDQIRLTLAIAQLLSADPIPLCLEGRAMIDGQEVVRQAVREITRIYAQLCERGASPRYLDVGGGLGVNYGAGYSDSEDENGINYSLQEYANAIVTAVQEVCEDRKVPEPVLVSRLPIA